MRRGPRQGPLPFTSGKHSANSDEPPISKLLLLNFVDLPWKHTLWSDILKKVGDL